MYLIKRMTKITSSGLSFIIVDIINRVHYLNRISTPGEVFCLYVTRKTTMISKLTENVFPVSIVQNRNEIILQADSRGRKIWVGLLNL